MKSPKKLFVRKPTTIVTRPIQKPIKDQLRIISLYFPNLKYPNKDSVKIIRPYPASPSMTPKNKIKKKPMMIAGFISLYFGVANTSKRPLNPSAHFGVSICVGGLSGFADGVANSQIT